MSGLGPKGADLREYKSCTFPLHSLLHPFTNIQPLSMSTNEAILGEILSQLHSLQVSQQTLQAKARLAYVSLRFAVLTPLLWFY